jgi:hypothetical protein
MNWTQHAKIWVEVSFAAVCIKKGAVNTPSVFFQKENGGSDLIQSRRFAVFSSFDHTKPSAK